MKQPSEFLPANKNRDHEDHQDDVFHKGLEIRHFNGIAEAAAFRNQVVYVIEKGEERIKDHHWQEYPCGTFYPEVENQTDPDNEFKSTLRNAEEKCEMVRPGSAERDKIILDLENKTHRVDSLYNSRENKDQPYNDPADSSKFLHAPPV
jgi:hypothetical protein